MPNSFNVTVDPSEDEFLDVNVDATFDHEYSVAVSKAQWDQFDNFLSEDEFAIDFNNIADVQAKLLYVMDWIVDVWDDDLFKVVFSVLHDFSYFIQSKELQDLIMWKSHMYIQHKEYIKKWLLQNWGKKETLAIENELRWIIENLSDLISKEE